MENLLRGEGVLFNDPSAERARQFFHTKPRALLDKVTTVAEAVQRLVRDGDYLAIGGFGADRIPTAVVHEVLRQGRQQLRLSRHTATHDFPVLAAGEGVGGGEALGEGGIPLRGGGGGAGPAPPPPR